MLSLQIHTEEIFPYEGANLPLHGQCYLMSGEAKHLNFFFCQNSDYELCSRSVRGRELPRAGAVPTGRGARGRVPLRRGVPAGVRARVRL